MPFLSVCSCVPSPYALLRKARGELRNTQEHPRGTPVLVLEVEEHNKTGILVGGKVCVAMRKVVIVTGSRNWTDHWIVFGALRDESPHLVVHGGCETGADSWADEWCRDWYVDTVTLRARWRVDGKLDRSAGPRRNLRMLKAYPGATVLAFPLDGPGTRGCIKLARELGMLVKVFGGDNR
jgi:hypothetical protein